MKRASLLDQTARQFGKGLGVSCGRFPLLNLGGRKRTHRTSPSIVRREFRMCSQCRSRSELIFLCGWRSIFSMKAPRNLEHFIFLNVALTTPSNACYARSPKPIWARKRNRGLGKRRHNNRQFKVHTYT